MPVAGTIFKRFDTNKLFVMTCQDVVERFHLCLSLLFVVAEVKSQHLKLHILLLKCSSGCPSHHQRKICIWGHLMMAERNWARSYHKPVDLLQVKKARVRIGSKAYLNARTIA